MFTIGKANGHLSCILGPSEFIPRKVLEVYLIPPTFTGVIQWSKYGSILLVGGYKPSQSQKIVINQPPKYW